MITNLAPFVWSPYTRSLAQTSPNFVLSHGKIAVIALATLGVGPDTASKVIRKLREAEEGFYRDILKAEVDYVRTRRFWV